MCKCAVCNSIHGQFKGGKGGAGGGMHGRPLPFFQTERDGNLDILRGSQRDALHLMAHRLAQRLCLSLGWVWVLGLGRRSAGCRAQLNNMKQIIVARSQCIGMPLAQAQLVLHCGSLLRQLQPVHLVIRDRRSSVRHRQWRDENVVVF